MSLTSSSHFKRSILIFIIFIILWRMYSWTTHIEEFESVDQHHVRKIRTIGNQQIREKRGKLVGAGRIISNDEENEQLALLNSKHKERKGSKSDDFHKSHDKNKHNIHFITVQTGSTPGWCRNMQSARHSGISVTSLGWQQPYAHSIRPLWIYKYLQTLQIPLDDVVLFSDGSDTMFTGVPPETILQRFEYIAREDYHGRRDFVMFNAEANCYHQQLFGGRGIPWGVMKGRCISVYKSFDPTIRTKWRYLNAGAWIGTVRAAIEFFSNASKVLKDGTDKSLWCDQSAIGGLFLKQTKGEEKDRSKFLVVLDTKNSIFLPTYHLRVKDDTCSASADGHDDAHNRIFHHPPKLVLCHSNRAPAVLHFNGKSGNAGIEAERRVKYLEEFGVKESDRTIRTWDTKSKTVVAQKFEDVCAKYA